MNHHFSSISYAITLNTVNEVLPLIMENTTTIKDSGVPYRQAMFVYFIFLLCLVVRLHTSFTANNTLLSRSCFYLSQSQRLKEEQKLSIITVAFNHYHLLVSDFMCHHYESFRKIIKECL